VLYIPSFPSLLGPERLVYLGSIAAFHLLLLNRKENKEEKKNICEKRWPKAVKRRAATKIYV
jgi:hypothetical protein